MRIAEAQLVRAVGELQKEGQLVGAELATAFARLIRRRRLSRRTGKISRALDTYAEVESGVLAVTATSARFLTEVDRTLVKARAATLLGKPGSDVAIEFREDLALIGGIRLETADMRYDSTIARSLKELRKSL